MHGILLYLENLPLINVQFVFTKVYTTVCILRAHGIFCIVIPYVCFVLLLCCSFLSLFSLHILTLCSIIFFYMSSKVISHTDIPLSSDIFLDSLMIDLHVIYICFCYSDDGLLLL